MTREVTLTVNDVPIQLDVYVFEYVYHMAKAMVHSLRGTGEIADLELTVDREGTVKINLNGEDVSLKPFPMLMITSTFDGLLKPLKGVTFPVNSIRVTVKQ